MIIVSNTTPLLDELIAQGTRISQQLYREVLAIAQE